MKVVSTETKSIGIRRKIEKNLCDIIDCLDNPSFYPTVSEFYSEMAELYVLLKIAKEFNFKHPHTSKNYIPTRKYEKQMNYLER